MKYERVEKAVFLSRPNRFTASVLLEDREEIPHEPHDRRARVIVTDRRVITTAKKEMQDK